MCHISKMKRFVSMTNWVKDTISFADYIKFYQNDDNVKFIPHTCNKGMIDVLVNKDVVKELNRTHVPTKALF